jgi:phosphoglycerate dehydrogenase-like enzyme
MSKTLLIYLQHELGSFRMDDSQAGRLAELLPTWRVVNAHTKAEFLSVLPDAVVVCCWTFRQEWFTLAPRLRVVSTPAAGKDYFSVQWPSGVEHWNGGFHGALMAETAVGMLLGMTRGLLPAVTTYRRKSWPRPELDAMMRPLAGSRVTICGFGKIGRHIGKLLKVFGVRLWGVSAHEHSVPDFFDKYDKCFVINDLNIILPKTDHLVLVLPRTPETDNFLDARRIALLPRHATVCNLGRGNAIDESALVEALSAGRLGGACLDVQATEPLPSQSPLRKCPNLWLFPHSSALSPNYMDLYADEVAERVTNLAQ